MSERLEAPSFEREATVTITKEDAPFAPEEQLGEWELERWSWFQKQGAINRSTDIIDEKRGLVKLRPENYYAEMLLITVRKHPETVPWSMNFITEQLDVNVGDILRGLCMEINGINEAERRIFLRQSEPEKDTPT